MQARKVQKSSYLEKIVSFARGFQAVCLIPMEGNERQQPEYRCAFIFYKEKSLILVQRPNSHHLEDRGLLFRGNILYVSGSRSKVRIFQAPLRFNFLTSIHFATLRTQHLYVPQNLRLPTALIHMSPDKSLQIHIYICVLLFPKEMSLCNYTLQLLLTFEAFPKCQPHLTKDYRSQR